MAAVFTAVLEAGVYGSVIVLAVLMFRALVKKVPGKWLCLLWLLAFLRLAMPFQIESSFSLQPNIIRFERENQPASVVQPTVQNAVPAVPEDALFPEDVTVSYGDAIVPPAVSGDQVIPDTPTVTVTPGNADTPAENHRVIDWLAVGGWVWLTGCVGFLGCGMVSYLGLKRRVREAVRCADGAWECAGLETAFILGFLRPRIYIPMGTSYGRELILTHERSHIARGDHWWKPLGYLILAVHWYNPLVWVAYLLLCRDVERACDERVVRDMTLEERKAYSTALLSCSSNRSRIAACPVAFGELSVKGRIQNVLNYRKPGFWVILTAAAAAVILAVCFLTTPKQEDPVEQCREALELLNARESCHILMEGNFEGNDHILQERTEQEYWKQGNHYAYRMYPISDTATYWLKKVDGVIYEKLDCATWVSPDMQPYDWRESDNPEADEMLQPWTARFVWEDARITLENREKTALGEAITLRILHEEYEILSRFGFDSSGNLTEIVNTFVSHQGKPYTGTQTITILETMEPADTIFVQENASGKTLLSSAADGCVQTYIHGDGDTSFGYVIKDKEGNVKHMEEGLTKEPLITELDGDIVKISMRTGTGLSTNWAVYYDAENQLFSQKYSFVLAEYGRWIAVYGEDSNMPAVTVMEMFGIGTPLKTIPLTGLEPGVTEPIKAVFRSADGQLSVTYQTGQSEHTAVIDMALGSDMTDLELLALCRAGLERYRSRGSYSFIINREITVHGQYTPESEEIYQIGGDYYRMRYCNDGDWRVFAYKLQKDGEQFTRTYRDVHEGNVMPVDTGWVRESFVPEQPWAWTFDFDAQEVTLLDTGEESGRKTVELLVAGSPGSHAPNVQEYTVRFILEGSGTPWRVILSYGDVMETIHFNSASEDMALMTFNAMYSQAVSAQE